MKTFTLLTLLALSATASATSYWHDYCRPGRAALELATETYPQEVFNVECQYDKWSGKNCEIEKKVKWFGFRANFSVTLTAESGNAYTYVVKYSEKDSACNLRGLDLKDVKISQDHILFHKLNAIETADEQWTFIKV